MAGARVSPTAHYTAYVWVAHGLSHPALATRLGRALHLAVRPFNAAYARLGGADLDAMLLARHRTIDERLAAAVASGRVAQVLEIAAGLSGRGARFVRRFPDLRYVEADLPAMARRKRAALGAAGLADPRLQIVTLDVLADTFVDEARGLLGDRPTAIIAEGLVSYLDRATLEAFWARCARLGALYLGDLNVRGELAGLRAALAFRGLLSVFTRGRVHLHFGDAAEAEAALRGAGFGDVVLHQPSTLVRVIEASRR